MIKERTRLIEWTRGEVVGPSRSMVAPTVIEFRGRDFIDPVALRNGPIVWRPSPDADTQEVLYFQRETPHRKYGAGTLHPTSQARSTEADPDVDAHAVDTLAIEPDEVESLEDLTSDDIDSEDAQEQSDLSEPAEDFQVTSSDVRCPSTMGISFCARLGLRGRIVVRLPTSRRFAWQDPDSEEFPLNGRYESAVRNWADEQGQAKDAPVWRRHPAVLPDTSVTIERDTLGGGRVLRCALQMPEGSPLQLCVECFARQLQGGADVWLITVVLRNTSQSQTVRGNHEATLYQSYFEVSIENGAIEKYPESQRPFAELDSDEQSLLLLYRESATWAIGHGCAAGWDSRPDEVPTLVYADVMPAVELPSMTPEITGADGMAIRLAMRALAGLSDDGTGEAWTALDCLSREYGVWIERQSRTAENLAPHLKSVASRHLAAARACRERIDAGLALLRTDDQVRRAFRLANLAMLLQQLSTKKLARRPLTWNAEQQIVAPEGQYRSAWDLFRDGSEPGSLGVWRAFQIAFLLMSLSGVSDEHGSDREMVDLIWFPTGGGKTEAYLGVMAFYMFHQRLLMIGEVTTLRDGTNVLMRYTLRMLTTQQFQRAASLICAMEFLRRDVGGHGMGPIPGGRFSLGLWIGGSGSPNDVKSARRDLNAFYDEKLPGNPLVLTECPWCRAEIGRYRASDRARPRGISVSQWRALCVRGIVDIKDEGPLLCCPDARCLFGADDWRQWLPVEVIDERIYRNPPSLVIATADKLAMMAFRPHSGALFGRVAGRDGAIKQLRRPPGLIVQDELHLISGPLGTVYGLYEAIFERLCSYWSDGRWVKPKIIASTATIRGAAGQVQALYARQSLQLFPSPGLLMGDSFFGRYAKHENGQCFSGRLYLGVHANGYGSILTTQVRVFSSMLFRAYGLDAASRDPWWTLLVFYNSIRELGGAKTLFDSDIRSRLKFVFNREGYLPADRRTLNIVEELTSRLSQAEIVAMIDRLSTALGSSDGSALDACLASNIIEVGVDIDRLSLMGVVGQPKSTAQYIQVTGRVGRRWWERPGLIVTFYNPFKSRDRSHFEQFHSYHRRLYERVEPTSATPFAASAIRRAAPGALVAWARQHSTAPVHDVEAYADAVERGHQILVERCQQVQPTPDQRRSLAELERVFDELRAKWAQNPQQWEQFPPSVDGEYLLLWPGQFATLTQQQRGLVAASSMRQVDGSAELAITQAYGTMP